MRKSTAIGLSWSYDWSNSNLPDDLLILKVLEHHDFQDVARVCAFYGLPRVKGVFERDIDNPLVSGILARMLRNVERGFSRAGALQG